MRQRLHIARGLLHKPDVLFLDEPSIGVDPVAARDLRRTVADLRTGGTTVLLTTHYMAEADELCDRIAVIAGGTIRALGTPDRLKSRVQERDILEIEAYGAADEHLDRIRELPGVRGVAAEDRGSRQAVMVQTDGAAARRHVRSAAQRQRARQPAGRARVVAVRAARARHRAPGLDASGLLGAADHLGCAGRARGDIGWCGRR